MSKPSYRYRRRLASRALLIALALTTWAPLKAQSQPSPPAEAQAIAQEAIQLANNGDYESAVGRFQAALEIDPGQHLFRFQLARLLAALGRYEEAGREFATVVRAMPENGAARRGEVTALLLAGRYGDARQKLEQGLVALPRDGQLAHTLARLLATAPDDSVRDGELALRLAQSVYEIKKMYETAETLAMAHAESGNFEEAINIQQSLIARAESDGDEIRLRDLQLRLASYRANQAWRAASPVEIATATEPPGSTSGAPNQPR